MILHYLGILNLKEEGEENKREAANQRGIHIGENIHAGTLINYIILQDFNKRRGQRKS